LSDAWFDWDTLFDAAGKLKNVDFELIGYGISERSLARLAQFSNIRFAGLVPQGDLHIYAQKWWAGIIPFQPSTLSAAVDPLKVYEYLHLGLPVVTTGIPGIGSYPMVRFARDSSSFASALEEIQERPGAELLAQTETFLRSCTWDERLGQLSNIMAQKVGFRLLYAE
jgi:glycosyltransferase involved in cell wall biosynthesis